MATADGGSVPANSATISASPASNVHPPSSDIASQLTIILTTSPTPSAPSTDLVSTVLEAFRTHCPALLACPVIVVFDTYDHIGPQLRLKKGCVTPVEAASYDAYKENVKRLVRDIWQSGDGETVEIENGLAEYGSPMIAGNVVPFTITKISGGKITFVEPTQRLGFGLAVRTAVRSATTPYVWVQQHDWTLAADIPVAAMLNVMRSSEKDVEGGQGLADSVGDDSTPAMDLYDQADEDSSPSTPGTPGTPTSGTQSPFFNTVLANSPALDPTLPVAIRYICLPSVRMLRYAGSAHAIGFPTLRALTATFKRDVPVLASDSKAPSEENGSSGDSSGVVPLAPLFFWHDKTHIASRTHYLRRVFASRLALSRGDFIEDHIGQRARAQMKRDPAAWHRWACWLYYPDDGNQLCLRHLQGRTWRGQEQEQAIRDQHVARNRDREAAKEAKAALATSTKTDTVDGDDSDGYIGLSFGSDDE